ncbi:hypothetical protein LTS18_003016, partial [Coniosporium uncinatum]
MESLLYIALLALSISNGAVAQGGAAAKNYAGAPGYPTAADWSSLNSSTNGQLIQYIPLYSVCYGSRYNATACAGFVKDSLTFKLNSIQDPALIETPYWAGTACPLPRIPPSGALPDSDCNQGNYPDYVLAAKNKEDIASGIKFAAKHDIRVIIKNTGHDFLGRSVGYGSFSIWTHNLDGVQWADDWHPTTNITSLRRRQTTKQAAITYGAGMLWGQVIEEAKKHGHIVISGADPSVGAAGGWPQGGGHGPHSNQYGLGADNMLEAEVVTPTGDFLIANENSNPDLFWALRGGGGGTYGIVTRMTMKTYPDPGSSYALIRIAPKAIGNYSHYLDALAYYFAITSQLTDFGLSGYPFLTHGGYTANLGAPGKTAKQLETFLGPLRTKLRSMGDVNIIARPYDVKNGTKSTCKKRFHTRAQPAVPDITNINIFNATHNIAIGPDYSF